MDYGEKITRDQTDAQYMFLREVCMLYFYYDLTDKTNYSSF